MQIKSQYQKIRLMVCSSLYVQYKFNVDGEWRHDEQKPFVSGNLGSAVNTIFLSREPDVIPTTYGPDVTGGNGMDVDATAGRMVRVSLLVAGLLLLCTHDN